MSTETTNNDQEFHVMVESEEARPATMLAEAAGVSVAQVKDAMSKGAVWLTDGTGTRRLRRKGKKLKVGSELHMYYNPEVLESTVEGAELIADEGDYSIWYKPYGMLSQGSKWGDHTTIARFAEQHFEFQRPVFVVHRLDRAATGLILLAHKKKAARALSDMFARRHVEKRYVVMVEGEFPLREYPMTLDEKIGGRPAFSHVQRVGFDDKTNRSLLEVEIDTGRKHQIRRHLAGFGFAVTGDRMYGEEAEVDLQLCSAFLSFNDPLVGGQKTYELPHSYQPALKAE